jgi:tetratricopeptide (TPR) repeat protein
MSETHRVIIHIRERHMGKSILGVQNDRPFVNGPWAWWALLCLMSVLMPFRIWAQSAPDSSVASSAAATQSHTQIYDREQAQELFKQGNIQFRQQSYQNAIEYYERALKFAPDVGALYVNLIVVYYKIDDCSSALGYINNYYSVIQEKNRAKVMAIKDECAANPAAAVLGYGILEVKPSQLLTGLSVDGDALPNPFSAQQFVVSAARHKIKGFHNQCKSESVEVRIEAGKIKVLPLEISCPSKVLPLSLLSAGVLLTGFGIYYDVRAAHFDQSVLEGPERNHLEDEFRFNRNRARVLMGLGVTSLLSGGFLYYIDHFHFGKASASKHYDWRSPLIVKF